MTNTVNIQPTVGYAARVGAAIHRLRVPSSAFIGLLQEYRIQVSMDGKGCWRDNVFVERLWKLVRDHSRLNGR